MAGTVVIPWYATGLRHDAFAQALTEIAAVAPRYGAQSWEVYRSRDDRYRFQQLATFATHLDWERYWEGPEMTEFRARHSGWYQVPVLYGWWDRIAAGGITAGGEPLADGAARDGGHANGHGERTVGEVL